MTQTIVPAAASHTEPASPQDVQAAEAVARAYRQMLEQMGTVIVGQREVMDLLLLGLLCEGHCILEGVPGLAKTLMISTLSKLLSLDFGRIQFTPDLMPSDITGTEILEEDQSTGRRVMRFVKGPLFANMILADEINRTPPKTQAALLQAMQEYQVTAAGVHYPLDKPFFVLGTQNPIESEGTYPLPEAQLDRFMFKIQVDYPKLDEEIDIAMATTGQRGGTLQPVVTKEQIIQMQQVVRRVIVARPVAAYAVRLVRATRPKDEANPDFIRHYLTWGAGPRACQALLLGAKAKALLDGRTNASIDDVRFIAKPVLRHRLVTNFTAESENISTDDVIEKLIEVTPEL
ncbi:MAG: MoxR family ATPase [Phycisphaeraceae bacterium]|nr:MoxR family ATPase [Phycisphaeraceae bacterium]